jgi:hypothetical protein
LEGQDMPSLNTYIVSVTVQYEVRGVDYASVAKLAEEHVKPALGQSAPGADYPLISCARIAGIEIEMPHLP